MSKLLNRLFGVGCMNNLIKHLLMWCPFIGLILFINREPWADRYLFENGKELRGFLCITIWQGAWISSSIIAIVWWVASLFCS